MTLTQWQRNMRRWAITLGALPKLALSSALIPPVFISILVTVLAQDTFNYTGSLTSPWATCTSPYTALQVVSGPQVELTTTSAGDGCAYYPTWSGNAWPANQQTSVTLNQILSTAQGTLAVGVRAATAAVTDYRIVVSGPLGASATIGIVKNVAGTHTTLVAPFTYTIPAGSIITARVVGTTITGYVNGAFVSGLTATDSSISSGVPLVSIESNGQSLTDVQFNNFVAGVVNSTTASSPPGTGVKWHPGHYCWSDNSIKGQYGSDNFSSLLTGIEAEIDLCFSNSNVKGYGISFPWATIESASGVYGGFSYIDTLRSYIATNHPGKRFAVSIDWARYTTNMAEYTDVVPNYITSSSSYGTSPTGGVYGWWGSSATGQIWAAAWRSAVYGRIEAMYAALASRTSPYSTGYTYDTDPYVEGITTVESAMNVGSSPPSDLSEATFQTAWLAINASLVSSFPHTNVWSQNNYFYGSSLPQTAYVSQQDIANGLSISGPDTVSSTLQTITYGQLGYVGDSSAAPYNTNEIGNAQYIAQVQGDWPPPIGSVSGATFSNIFNQAAGNGTEQFQAGQIWWTVIQSTGNTGDWTGTVSPGITANPIPSGNDYCPSNFTARGGCNTSYVMPAQLRRRAANDASFTAEEAA